MQICGTGDLLNQILPSLSEDGYKLGDAHTAAGGIRACSAVMQPGYSVERWSG